MTPFKISRPTTPKIKTQADIVFCIDVTGSMGPCIEGVKNAVSSFVEGLQSQAEVNFRVRLIAYRDRHHPQAQSEPWTITPFMTSADEFRKIVAAQQPVGGGDDPESTLDALYLAIHSDWRPSKTHKTIVLLTDDDTHPTLHPTTYSRPDNNIHRVIQDFQTLRHVMLFMVVPRYPLYEQLEQSMQHADRKIVANFVPPKDDRYTGLKEIPFDSLLKMLGQTISLTSVAVATEAGI